MHITCASLVFVLLGLPSYAVPLGQCADTSKPPRGVVGIDNITTSNTPDTIPARPEESRIAENAIGTNSKVRPNDSALGATASSDSVQAPQLAVSSLYTVTHFAGSAGGGGNFDGVGSSARFYRPSGVVTDSAGNVYVADQWSHTIRKITPARVVTTVAGLALSYGSSDGALSGRFRDPAGVAIDSAGNIYVADYENHTIRKITAAGNVTTLAGHAGTYGSADGSGAAALFYRPSGVATDSLGNVYVADSYNNTIRKITAAGVVTTLAGLAGTSGSSDGTGTGALFNRPSGVATDSARNVYVADTYNDTIRKITPAGVVTTLAGSAGNWGSTDGTGSAARFSHPSAVATDSAGNIYVPDSSTHIIRKVTSAGVVTTIAGQASTPGSADGIGSAARFDYPSGVATDSTGNVYVADQENNTIRKITPAGAVTTLAGLAGTSGSADNTGSSATFNGASGLTTDVAGNVYVADQLNNIIRKITPAGAVTTLAGQAGTSGTSDGSGSAARFYNPRDVATDSAGNIYVADGNNDAIRKITPAGVVTTLAGQAGSGGSTDGIGSAARFEYPSGVATDAAGNVYVADTNNNTIRKITAAAAVTTLAGMAPTGMAGTCGSVDGTGNAARFCNPSGLATDAAGNIYVADTRNATIRKITPAGVVTTIAGFAGVSGSDDGIGTAARFKGPTAIATDSAGNLYVADGGNSTIRQITSAGVVTTLAGQAGIPGNSDGTGRAAHFIYPSGVAIDSAGNLFVADWSTIRRGRVAIPDLATIDSTTGRVGVVRQLDVSPATATAFQWSMIRVPATSSATLSSTTVRNPTFTPDVAGRFEFRVTASNSSGSSITTVALEAWLPPTAVVSGSGLSCGPGSPVTISADLTGTAPWSITWSDGVVQTALTTTPVTRSVSPEVTTTYTVTTVSDPNATGTSSGSSNVTIGTPPAATAAGATTCPSAAASISVNLTGSAPWTIGWSDGFVQNNITTSQATRNVTPSVTTAYTISSLADATCSVRTNVTATVAIIPTSVRISTTAYACASSSSNTATVPDFGPGATYAWSISNGTIGGGSGTRSITFSPAGAGSVGLSISVAGPSCSGAGSVTIPLQQCGTSTPGYVFTHFAGTTGGPGHYDGSGSAARISFASHVATDAAGNIYVADSGNRTIRKITTAGLVTTLAGQAGSPGSADGVGAAARFSGPWGIATDAAGNVYVADRSNNTIRKITPVGVVTTLAGKAAYSGTADGIGSSARFYGPRDVATDLVGNIFVADYMNDTIRKITPAGVVTTFAGHAGTSGSTDGSVNVALLNNPAGVATDSAGNVYVSELFDDTIRKISPAGMVTTVAGTAGAFGYADGTGSSARFFEPNDVATDSAGNVYVADLMNNAIRKITPNAVVSTLAGDPSFWGWIDGIGSGAHFYQPSGVASDLAGNIYVADQQNSTIRKTTPAGAVTTVAGTPAIWGAIDDVGSAARFHVPVGVTTDAAGNVYVADAQNCTIRKITTAGLVSTLAGQPRIIGSSDGTGSAALFGYPTGVAADALGNIYVADPGNNNIRKITSGGVVTTVAGQAGLGGFGTTDGTGTTARFGSPTGVAIDLAKNIYVTDHENNTIRKITPQGVVTTFAGQAGTSGSNDGTGNDAHFHGPIGVATDLVGNIYVADYYNDSIRKITPAGIVTTLAGRAGYSGSADGTGSDARFARPAAVTTDPAGNLYVADANSSIRKITPAGVVTTLAGQPGSYGSADGTGSTARFNGPSGVAVDPTGNLYVADSSNEAIRIGRAAIPDAAVIDSATGAVGVIRQLDVSPLNATAFEWRLIRVPSGSTASLSSPSLRNPTFTPDVAGRFEFLLTASNSVGTSITTVGLFAGLLGDVNGDGDVDVADIFYLINILFTGAQPRGPGDVNGDSQLTAADIFYFINYLFANGPAPRA